MILKKLFKSNNKVLYMSVSSNYYPNKHLFIPKAMTINGLQPLINYKYIKQKLTDKELGELVIEALKNSKAYRKRDIIENTKSITRKRHEDYLNGFEMGNIHVDVKLDYDKNEYTIQRTYIIANNKVEEKDTPIHVIPGDASALELGKTIKIAFFDVGIKEAEMLKNKQYAHISIYRNINSNKIMVRPSGFGHLNLLTELYDFKIVDGQIDDYSLGKLAIDYLKRSEESIGKNISIKPNDYDKELKKQKVKELLKNSQNISVTINHKKSEYRINKSYRYSKNSHMMKKDDPEHILDKNCSYELLGKTIREAFDDVSAEGKTI